MNLHGNIQSLTKNVIIFNGTGCFPAVAYICYTSGQSNLCLVHTSNANKTRLSRLVLSVSVVWTEFATSQNCRRQKILKLFCPVLKCGGDHWKQSCWPILFTPPIIQDKTVLSMVRKGKERWWCELRIRVTRSQVCHIMSVNNTCFLPVKPHTPFSI